MEDSHYFLKKKYDFIKKQNREKYNENSKRRLMSIINKKLHTTMIGALSFFENEFGYLWGHKQEDELSSDQLEFLQIWEKVRKEILNNGNTQLRACMEELDQYTVKWNRYHTQFIVKGN